MAKKHYTFSIPATFIFDVSAEDEEQARVQAAAFAARCTARARQVAELLSVTQPRVVFAVTASPVLEDERE